MSHGLGNDVYDDPFGMFDNVYEGVKLPEVRIEPQEDVSNPVSEVSGKSESKTGENVPKAKKTEASKAKPKPKSKSKSKPKSKARNTSKVSPKVEPKTETAGAVRDSNPIAGSTPVADAKPEPEVEPKAETPVKSEVKSEAEIPVSPAADAIGIGVRDETPKVETDAAESEVDTEAK